jgi:hypothetical protein
VKLPVFAWMSLQPVVRYQWKGKDQNRDFLFDNKAKKESTENKVVSITQLICPQ